MQEHKRKEKYKHALVSSHSTINFSQISFTGSIICGSILYYIYIKKNPLLGGKQKDSRAPKFACQEVSNPFKDNKNNRFILSHRDF